MLEVDEPKIRKIDELVVNSYTAILIFDGIWILNTSFQYKKQEDVANLIKGKSPFQSSAAQDP
jgi:hypothetical protein